jgi:hypothetical protein
MKCADGAVRRCFPVLSCVVADYEEQCILTGIKHREHCPKCLIPPTDRHDLTRSAPQRTHKTTRDQLQKQSGLGPYRKASKEEKPWYLNYTSNFAWHHPKTDIHHCIAFDLLHVFFSNGLVDRLIGWMQTILKQHYSSPGTKRLTYQEVLKRIDTRIQLAPCFPKFEVIKKPYSTITQKSGKEMKAISRILVPVMAPLVTPICKTSMMFIRAFCDFLTVAQYRSHDDDTLEYLQQYLRIMNSCKAPLVDAIDVDNSSGKKSLNFPKWHAITHVAESIRTFGTLDGTDTSTSEGHHSIWFKQLAGNTNFRETWTEQLLHLTDRNFLQMVKVDLARYCPPTASPIPPDIPAHVTTTITGSQRVDGLELSGSRTQFLQGLQLFRPGQRIPYEVAKWARLPNLVDLLPSFIEEQRTKWIKDNPGFITSHPITIEPDELEAGGILLKLHTGIKFWEPDLQSANPDDQIQCKATCKWDWQGQGEWRRGFVWAQERHQLEDVQPPGEPGLKGRLPVQLLLVFTVHDIHFHSYKILSRQDVIFPTYSAALVREFRPVQGAKYHPVHGLVEFRAIEKPPGPTPRQRLGCDRIYPIECLGPSIQLFPSEDAKHYFNPYIDYQSFNNMWDPEYFNDGIRISKQINNYTQKRKAGRIDVPPSLYNKKRRT